MRKIQKKRHDDIALVFGFDLPEKQMHSYIYCEEPKPKKSEKTQQLDCLDCLKLTNKILMQELETQVSAISNSLIPIQMQFLIKTCSDN